MEGRMNDTAGVRTIERGAPPERFARGWHCLGLAERFRDSGPHTGGDLTLGTVKGDAIACPFHDWRWGGNGRCQRIPYSRRVPPAARTRSWVTLEQNQQLF